MNTDKSNDTDMETSTSQQNGKDSDSEYDSSITDGTESSQSFDLNLDDMIKSYDNKNSGMTFDEISLAEYNQFKERNAVEKTNNTNGPLNKPRKQRKITESYEEQTKCGIGKKTFSDIKNGDIVDVTGETYNTQIQSHREDDTSRNNTTHGMHSTNNKSDELHRYEQNQASQLSTKKNKEDPSTSETLETATEEDVIMDQYEDPSDILPKDKHSYHERNNPQPSPEKKKKASKVPEIETTLTDNSTADTKNKVITYGTRAKKVSFNKQVQVETIINKSESVENEKINKSQTGSTNYPKFSKPRYDQTQSYPQFTLIAKVKPNYTQNIQERGYSFSDQKNLYP